MLKKFARINHPYHDDVIRMKLLLLINLFGPGTYYYQNETKLLKYYFDINEDRNQIDYQKRRHPTMKWGYHNDLHGDGFFFFRDENDAVLAKLSI
jgi:hypothetical protein